MDDDNVAGSYNYPTTILTAKQPTLAAAIIPHALDSQHKLNTAVLLWMDEYIGMLQQHTQQLKLAFEKGQKVFAAGGVADDEFGNFPQYWNCLLTSLKLEAQSNDLMVKNLKLDVVNPLRADTDDARALELIVNGQELQEIADDYALGRNQAEVQWNYKAPQIFETFELYKSHQLGLLFNTVVTWFQIDNAKLQKGLANNENSTNYLVSNYKLDGQMQQYLDVITAKDYRHEKGAGTAAVAGVTGAAGGAPSVPKHRPFHQPAPPKQARRLLSFLNLIHLGGKEKDKKLLKLKVGLIFGRKKKDKKHTGDVGAIPEDALLVTALTGGPSRLTLRKGRGHGAAAGAVAAGAGAVGAAGYAAHHGHDDDRHPERELAKQENDPFSQPELIPGRGKPLPPMLALQAPLVPGNNNLLPATPQVGGEFGDSSAFGTPVEGHEKDGLDDVEHGNGFKGQQGQNQGFQGQQGQNQGQQAQNQGFQGFQGQNQGFRSQNQGFQGQTQGFQGQQGQSQGFQGQNQGFQGQQGQNQGFNQNQPHQSQNQPLQSQQSFSENQPRSLSQKPSNPPPIPLALSKAPFEHDRATPVPEDSFLTPFTPTTAAAVAAADSSPNFVEYHELELLDESSDLDPNRLLMLKRHDINTPQHASRNPNAGLYPEARDLKFSFEHGDEGLPEPNIEHELGSPQAKRGLKAAPPPPPSRKVVHHEGQAGQRGSLSGRDDRPGQDRRFSQDRVSQDRVPSQDRVSSQDRVPSFGQGTERASQPPQIHVGPEVGSTEIPGLDHKNLPLDPPGYDGDALAPFHDAKDPLAFAQSSLGPSTGVLGAAAAGTAALGAATIGVMGQDAKTLTETTEASLAPGSDPFSAPPLALLAPSLDPVGPDSSRSMASKPRVALEMFHGLPATRNLVIPTQLTAQDTGVSLMLKADTFKHFEHGYSLTTGLNALVAEVVNASFHDGQLLRAKIVGEVAFNYRLGANEDMPPRQPLAIDVVPAHKFDKVILNNELMVPTSGTGYELLAANITSKTLGGLKYLIRNTAEALVPLTISQIWKYEAHQALLIIVVRPDPLVTEKIVVENLVITVALNNDVEVLGAKLSPHGSFNKDKNRLTWRYTSPLALGGSGAAEEKLMARFMTSGVASEHELGVQIKFQIHEPPGKNVTVLAGGNEVPVVRNLISGNYSGHAV